MNLRRLLAPRHIAVIGGRHAAQVIRQCRGLGFEGELWPVHPRHATVEGLPCFPDVAALPEAPDASFVAVPREASVDVVAALASRGAGGGVCYASGFAEVGGEGIALQRKLIDAAGDLAVIGPNCYGVLNYLDGAALWPDQHGGRRVDRGVAIITQSGNVGVNLTMQRRGLPLGYLISAGNLAGVTLADLIAAVVADPRISAIGLHIEGLDDVAGFARVAVQAHDRGVPLVVLKSGSSELGARIAVSHTSSLVGSDGAYDALFRRLGIGRVRDVAGLVETLKFLSMHGPLPGNRISSASCSGGEASLVADLAQPRGIDLPPIPPAARERLHAVLGDKVAIGNPLDYHTYIWGDLAAQTECFAALVSSGFDVNLLLLDFPREDRCGTAEWTTTLDAFTAALGTSRGCVVSMLPEGLPEAVGERLLARGIAPMQGIADCLDAIAVAAWMGVERDHVVPHPAEPVDAHPVTLDEWRSKRALAARGLSVPDGGLVGADQAVAWAEQLGYPVVVKAVSSALAHKSEAGAVKLGLRDADAVRAAVADLAELSDWFLVESMATDVVAELVVGVHRDRLGFVLTIGAGGVLVELLRDTATLLLPVSREDVHRALAGLRTWPLLDGYRGRPPGDVEAVVDAVMAIADYAPRVTEVEVNPLLVLPKGRGAVAVDALITVSGDG